MTKEIFEQYNLLVHFLGKTLGPDYEIALADLEQPQPGIVAIANGHVSGRSVGSPLTNMAIHIIAERSYETSDYKLNYSGQTENGKVLRCSTFFIKNEKGALTGLFCINFDDFRYKELSERIFLLCHPDNYAQLSVHIESKMAPFESSFEEHETFFSNISAAIDGVLSGILNGRDIPPERLTMDEKMLIIRTLNEKKIFQMKGAVNEVAEKLQCSVASVYRYISQTK